jgi:hypothetical protein
VSFCLSVCLSHHVWQAPVRPQVGEQLQEQALLPELKDAAAEQELPGPRHVGREQRLAVLAIADPLRNLKRGASQGVCTLQQFPMPLRKPAAPYSSFQCR